MVLLFWILLLNGLKKTGNTGSQGLAISPPEYIPDTPYVAPALPLK